MTRQALKLHPDSRCEAVTRLEAEVAVPHRSQLVLRWFVSGKISDLLLPPVTAATRMDELWRHTCFEAFVRASTREGYYEFNFAPSTQWAAYRFEDYRVGTSVLNEISAPRIEVKSDDAGFELQASLKLDRLPASPADAAWRLGLSAVIEEANGRLSYWALAHPPGEPDFHHPDCFVLALPRA
jgi:hypothetical protein